MTKRHESLELLLLLGAFVLATAVGYAIDHPRLEMMIALTAIIAIMTFIARYRHRRQIQTYPHKGRRKRNK